MRGKALSSETTIAASLHPSALLLNIHLFFCVVLRELPSSSLLPPSLPHPPPSSSLSPSLSPTSPSDSERNKKSHITPLIGLSGEVTSAGKTAKQFDRREEGRGRKVKHPALARPRRFVSFLFRSQTLGVEHHLNVSC